MNFKKKITIKITFLLVLVFISAMLIIACSKEKSSGSTSDTSTSKVADEDLPVFTAEDLAKYNGKEGQPAYVAYEGKVYDVTNISAWKGGTHQKKFEAGKDYTEILNDQAPHSSDNLTENAPVVGIYE